MNAQHHYGFAVGEVRNGALHGFDAPRGGRGGRSELGDLLLSGFEEYYVFFNPEHSRLHESMLFAEGYDAVVTSSLPAESRFRSPWIARFKRRTSAEARGLDFIVNKPPPVEVTRILVLVGGKEVLLAPQPDRGYVFAPRVHVRGRDDVVASVVGRCGLRKKVFDALPNTPQNQMARMFDRIERTHDVQIAQCELKGAVLTARIDTVAALRDHYLGAALDWRVRYPDDRFPYDGFDGKGRELLRTTVESMGEIIQSGVRDPDDRRTAMYKFANGDLRIVVSMDTVACQPDSYYFFYFGEFALACVKLGIGDPGEWLHFAQVAISAQEVFMRVYGPRGTGRKSADLLVYGPENFDASKRFGEDALRDLWAAYADHDARKLDRALSANVQRALRLAREGS